jgi:hypothetical protein
VYLRFGDAPAPTGRPELGVDDEYLAYEARPDRAKHGDGRPSSDSSEFGRLKDWPKSDISDLGRSRRGHGALTAGRRVSLADLAAGRAKGRTSPNEITYSERGNLQGAQFYAVAGKVYELAKRAGLGREIPTDWFLQDIRN